jgi:hypothetical protein
MDFHDAAGFVPAAKSACDRILECGLSGDRRKKKEIPPFTSLTAVCTRSCSGRRPPSPTASNPAHANTPVDSIVLATMLASSPLGESHSRGHGVQIRRATTSISLRWWMRFFNQP